jgi:hypothetical protein
MKETGLAWFGGEIGVGDGDGGAGDAEGWPGVDLTDRNLLF